VGGYWDLNPGPLDPQSAGCLTLTLPRAEIKHLLAAILLLVWPVNAILRPQTFAESDQQSVDEMRERTFTIIEREINGKVRLYCRTSYTGADGKRHTIWRAGRNKTVARNRCREELLKKLAEVDIGSSHNRTFKHLSDIFRERYLIEPSYVDGRKVAGMRSFQSALYNLNALDALFADRRLGRLTYNDLEDYKAARLKTPTQGKSKETRRQRKIASVNREMALLRRMLRKAVQMRWLTRSPFDDGEGLISMADEVSRTRTLSREEEGRLLAAANPVLRGILICALDTAMRFGEIITLRWQDVDLFAETITILGMNTKTLRPRNVPITKRLREEFLRLNVKHLPDLDNSVFGITDNVRRSFKRACEKAGITNFKIHDCRATCITRWIEGGIPDSLAGQLAGQTTPRTTLRYTRTSDATLKQAAEILDHAATLLIPEKRTA